MSAAISGDSITRNDSYGAASATATPSVELLEARAGRDDHRFLLDHPEPRRRLDRQELVLRRDEILLRRLVQRTDDVDDRRSRILLELCLNALGLRARLRVVCGRGV